MLPRIIFILSGVFIVPIDLPTFHLGLTIPEKLLIRIYVRKNGL